MPIPALNSNGVLPAGIFDCSLAELRDRFGRFTGSDRRVRLFGRLEELAIAFRSSQLFHALIIDGSFVTAKPAPNDIDLIAVLRRGHSFERDIPMAQYALVSRALLMKRFGFDVMVAEEDSALYRTYVEFFSRVREEPDLRKGILRVLL